MPRLLYASCYFEGWICKGRVSALMELTVRQKRGRIIMVQEHQGPESGVGGVALARIHLSEQDTVEY